MGRYRGKHYNPNHNANRGGPSRYQKYVPRQARQQGPPTSQKPRGVLNRLREGLENRAHEYKERNSPENRKRRIADLALQAKEERIKTDIYKTKKVRSQGRLDALSRLSGGGGGRRSGRRSGTGVRDLGFGGMGNMGMDARQTSSNWGGMNDLLGIPRQKKGKRSRYY